MGVIAAVEAFRVTGGFGTLQKCHQILHTNYVTAKEATQLVCMDMRPGHEANADGSNPASAAFSGNIRGTASCPRMCIYYCVSP
jgi:hypothetical protein